MPVNEHLMANLQKRYGEAEGERVYYAMEGEGKGPFAPGNKLHGDHLAFAAKHHLAPIMAKAVKAKPRKTGRAAAPKAPRPMHKFRSTPAPKR